jgi:hypothetical protein
MAGREQLDLAGLLGAQPLPGPMQLRNAPPPPVEALSLLTSLEDVRIAARRTAASAQRLMSIYTSDLEPEVYDQPAFLEIVKRFVLGRSFAKVRVLVHEHLRLIGNTNRFVAMSRRLSSYIEIRVVAPAFQHRRSAMLIADDRAIVYRTRASSWEGVAGFNQPPVARLHLQEFDQMWVASAPEKELRSGQR